MSGDRPSALIAPTLSVAIVPIYNFGAEPIGGDRPPCEPINGDRPSVLIASSLSVATVPLRLLYLAYRWRSSRYTSGATPMVGDRPTTLVVSSLSLAITLLRL